MLKEEEFVEIYEYVQGRVNSFPSYECPKRRTSIEKAKVFIETHHDISEEIFDFITFIFVLRTSSMNRFTTIPFNQFTSKNAYLHYKGKTDQQTYFLNKFQLDRELRNPIKRKDELSFVYLDTQRRKHFNTPRGYLNCLTFEGKLYDENECRKCRYDYICKQNK